MSIDQIKSIIVGKWQYQDGRILEFTSQENFNLAPRGGGETIISSKIFFKEQNGIITLSMTFEPIGIIKFANQNKIIYDSVNLDGTKREMVLTRI